MQILLKQNSANIQINAYSVEYIWKCECSKIKMCKQTLPINLPNFDAVYIKFFAVFSKTDVFRI